MVSLEEKIKKKLKSESASPKNDGLRSTISKVADSAKTRASTKPSYKEPSKWYKGSEPTETETLARIMSVSKNDDAAGRELYSLYEQSKQEGHWKETYDKATSPYAQALGVDPSQINDAFFEANAGLLNSGVHTSTGGLSSAKKNGPEALLAYNLSGLYEDYQATKELQAEQDLIVKEANYWMNKGLSDDEIKQKLGIGAEGGKYKGINSAIDRSRAGEFTPTTAPIWAATSWGIDGMLWSIRNPELSTGDYFADAIQKDMGRGSKAKSATPEEIARRTPGSAEWAPYAAGTTLDDEAILFGVQEFTPDWIEKNRQRILSSGTDAEKAAFASVWEVEQRTLQAEEQAAQWAEDVQDLIDAGYAPDDIFNDEFLSGYSTLAEMQEGIMKGQPVGLTRGVDFDLYTKKKQIEEAYNLKQAQQNAPKDDAAMDAAVEAEKEALLQQNGSLPDSSTTPVSLTATEPTIYDEAPDKAFKKGILWAGAGLKSGVKEAQEDYVKDQPETPDSAPYRLAGAYSEWTDEQKDAAQNYISDSKGGHDTADAVAEMKEAGLSDEEINAFRSQMTDALGSADYSDELMDAWFEPVETEAPSEESAATYAPAEIETAIADGENAVAAEMQAANLAAKIEQHPELMTTDNSQKGWILATALLAESGLVDDPEINAKGREYAEAASLASNISEDAGGLYAFVDNAFGGAISQTSDNKGIGLWDTIKYSMLSGAAKLYDVPASVAGWAIQVYAEAVRLSNDLLNAVGIDASDMMADKISETGEKLSNAFEPTIEKYDTYLRENASTLEYFAATAGSEIMKQFGMGYLSKALGAASAAGKTGEIMGSGLTRSLQTALDTARVNNIMKFTYSLPFAMEAGAGEFEEAYQKTDDVLTSTLSGLTATGVTLSTMDMGGFLKSIELQGRDVLPEITDSLASVPGSGVMAHLLRGGKARLMWFGNMLANGANEGMQEAVEKVLTDAATAPFKGESIFDKDLGDYSAEVFAEGAMAFLANVGNIAGTFGPYARTIKVIEAQERKSNFTPDDAADLTKAFIADLNDPQVMEDAQRRAQQIAVEARTGELIAEGAMPEVDTSGVAAAQEAAAAAQEKADETALASQQAAEAADAANERFNQNLADPQAASEAKSAFQKKNAAEQANAKAQKEAQKANEKLAAEQEAVSAQQTAAFETVREQARVEVEQRNAALNTARAEAEVAAEAKQQNDNVLALEADNFVNTYFSEASDDQKKTIRDRYMSYDGEAQNATRSMVEFAGQISKKFNLSIKFTDSHGIFEGAYTGGNQIVLDKNATQGDVIKRVLVHEITHAAETSKNYDALADAVLEAYYGDNVDQINADIAEKARQYAETAGQEGEAIARAELVADRLGEMLSSNQEALNRLVAEKPDVATRIWRAIKEFIGKLTGIKNAELDKYIQLEKKLEKALSTRRPGSEGNKFLIEYTTDGLPVVVINEDILAGVKEKDWLKQTAEILKKRFANGVPAGNNIIRVNNQSRNEFTRSKSSQWLRNNDKPVYKDKLRTAANADELIKASHDYVNEAPNHPRKDKLDDFARGDVTIQIGQKWYDAEVVVGHDSRGWLQFHDLLSLNRIPAKQKKTSRPVGAKASLSDVAGLSENSIVDTSLDVKQEIAGENGEPAAEIIRGGATKYSLSSWTASEKETVRKNLVNDGYEPDRVDKWIDDVDGVAAIIAADKDRLDYKAADNQVMLKNNQEYVKTLDASTLCAKRLLYQGTFNEIQHAMPNTVLTSEDLLHLSDMMNQAGLETPCGVCYVESRRRHLGKFAQEWLDGYNGDYKPTLDEVTTTDGLEALRHSHPDTYQSFVRAMNSKGSANPKVVQLRTDYRGDIRKLKKGETEKITKIGGLRIQSFSDFETPHLIDMMQAVLDMSGKKISAQAYTKVPNFAWVFGDTGIKINLSLLAEGNGLNEDGSLRFSSKEGMDIDEAMRLRERYSENVGTILVGVSEEHIRAAMADPRIDYIIPFHKSGWGQNELNLLPVLNSYDNFEDYQNERSITGYHKNGKPKYGKPEGGNFYPIDYWDYSKSGDENAATYLRMCEEDGRVPKFEQFLEKDSEGHWVAPSGYWKMLIDFKMYDNDGNGAPQKPVLPIFNMDEAVRVLNEYEGGADTLPVAYDIVDRFVAEKKAANPGVRFSLPKTETEVRDKTYLKAVEDGDNDTARRMVEQKAQEEGFTNAVPEQTLAYSVRKGAPPKKTIKVYKVFTVSPDGKPTALFVSGTEELPQNVWLDAQDTWHFTAKNGHEYVPSTQNPYTDGGKTGAQVEVPNDEIRNELIKRGFLPAGSKAKAVTALAYRPGWHAGDLPFFPQGGMKREGSNYENIHRYNQVVFECEFDADYDYTEEALNQDKAKTKKGTINYRNADLQYMPTGGFYKYATNPLTMQGGHGAWFIGGSLKIGRALTQQECDSILNQNGFLPQEWEQGELDLSALGYTGEQFDAAKKTLAPITYDDEGNVIPLSKRFDRRVNDIRFSLPSNDILDQRIAQHRNQMLAAPNGMIPSDDGAQQTYGNGERQFAGQTIQNSAVVPDWIKREFLRPEELNYEVSSNREQVERGWQRIQQNGYEAERDRLLSLDRYSSDDTAEANLMMAMALREDTADPATFMALASHYNKEGTKAGQELQARKLFTRMSPTGARVWAAGQMETRLEEHMRTHQNQRRKIDENASRIADQIRDMQGGDEVLRLNAGGDFTIDESNNRWGIPINEQQQALIDHYNLNNVNRPGIFYNRATTKQRMLEAILATPNPLEVTGLGLNLVQRLEYMNDGEAVITNADLNYIGIQLGQFVAAGGDEGGRDANLAVSRAYEAYGNISPLTVREKLRTWRYVSMLLSVPSAIRNVIGNAGQNVVNATAHGIAVELDKALSNITGKRTVEHLSYQERIDGWRGFVDETQNTFRDYFTDRSVTQRGNAKYNTNQRGRVYQNGFLETMRNMEGFLMSFGDRNIWRKAYLNSMSEQQKLADRGLLFNDDGTTRTHEQMLEQAEADANYATFTEDSRVSDVLSQLKNIPGLGEVVDFIMPFTGVPTNITRRMIQYSPVGLVEIALRHGYRAATGQNFNQRAFVDSLSRVLTGTGLFGVGMMLAAAGIIKPGTGDEDDDKKYGLKTAMGEQYTPFVYNPLNGKYVSLATFAPAASPLTMGLAAYYEFKENDDWLQALINACFSGADQIFDASYMSGIQDIFKGYGSPAENITNTLFSNAVSQSVPALMTQLANTIDPYVRDTKDKNALMQALKSGLINKIPGLREALLPVKIDVTGQPVRTKEGAWNFIDPFTTTDAREDPAVEEQLRLSDALGSSSMLPSDALSGSKTTLTVNKQKVTLDDAGKETYRRRYGELWLEGGVTIDKKGKPVKVEGVRNLISSPAYHLMDDEKRAKAIAAILSDAKTGASMEALNKYGAD